MILFSVSSSNFIDTMFVYLLIASGIMLIVLTALMVFFVAAVHYKKRIIPKGVDESITLEVLWMVFPLILFSCLFYFGFR
ncbi:MAG: hypothetical protein H3C35_08915 [Bacteroidetes bacterium]|nr:hypothetical protein [Bacteroidota bacterium]